MRLTTFAITPLPDEQRWNEKNEKRKKLTRMAQVIRFFFQITWGYRQNLVAEKGVSCMKRCETNHEGRWVYCSYIKRNGKIIYPKNAKVFKFWMSSK